MGERKIIPIPFGEGLQRSQGVMIVAPTTFADLRNVYQFRGKAQVRKGMTETDILVDDAAANLDRTLALGPLRAENAALGVGQDTATDEIWVNRLTIQGGNATNIGLFGTLSNQVTFNPPIIILADSDNKGFITHDEPNINARLVTKYYDPSAFPQLVTLQADLDGDGLADVYFRGVVRHLSYIFGWGYGSASEPDRIDVVRVSTAGDPTIFRDDAFFEVGQRGEPVMCCRPAGQYLMVFKETETYQIFGYSPDTFGIRPSDTLFGCVSSRLAVSVAGTVFFWSVQGPRVTTGGESQDIAVPLDLDGPDPSTLVAEAEVQNAFAEYDPATRVVHFVWGQRVYALSIRDPSNPRWSYYELQETIQCGGQFFSTQSTAGGGAQPADGPEFDAITPLDNETASTVDAHWDNVGATGGEQIEVWARESPAGSWSQVAEFTYNGSGSQSGTVSGLLPATDYDFALRYRRGGQYNPSATGSDPAAWPAVAQASDTTADSVPTAVTRGDNNGLWEVIGGTEQITIQWTIPTGSEGLQIQIERQIRTEGDTTVQNIGALGIGPPGTTDPAPSGYSVLTTLPAGTTSFVDDSLTPHRWHDYRISFVGSSLYSQIECWAGPDKTPSFSASALSTTSKVVFLTWTNASTPTGRSGCPSGTPPANHYTEFYENDDTADPASDGWSLMDSSSGGLSPPYATSENGLAAVSGDAHSDSIAARHTVTCFGTAYPSPWSTKRTVVCGTAEI